MVGMLWAIPCCPTARGLDEAFKWFQWPIKWIPESAAINDGVGWAYYLKSDAKWLWPYIQYAYGKEPEAESRRTFGRESYGRLETKTRPKKSGMTAWKRGSLISRY